MSKAEKADPPNPTLYVGGALANQAPAPRVAITSRVIHQWRKDPPEMHIGLSDGRTVRVQWDVEYATRALFVAANADADFIPCAGEETGLDAAQLERAVDEVYEAVREFDREQAIDSSGYGEADMEHR